jgi:hypothetical protein
MSELKSTYKAKPLVPLARQCANCSHFDRYAHDPIKGRCLRHAPRPYVVAHGQSEFDKTLRAYWPVTDEMDYCGEFAEKKT